MGKKSRNVQGLMQEYVDTDTGELIRQTVTTEVIEGYVDVKLPEKHKFNNGNFIVLFQKSMLEVIKHRKNFQRYELELLLYFLGTAGIANSIYVDYPTLMEDLGYARSIVVKAVRGLEKKGIILRAKAKGRQQDESQLMKVSMNFDQLNYNFGYNGKIKEFSVLKNDHPPLAIENKETKNQLKFDF